MKHLVTLLLTFVCIAGFSQAPEETGLIQTNTYSIRYPLSWTIDSSRSLGADLFIFSAKESDIDKFQENVNVMIQDLTGMSMTLDKYVSTSEQQISSMIMDGSIIESKRIKNGDNEYHKMLYQGMYGTVMLKVEQYYFIHAEKAFVVTLTTLKDTFELYKKAGEMMLNSFKLVK